MGYDSIACNLAESSVRDVQFKEININLNDLVIAYGDHVGKPALRELIAGFYPGINAHDVLLTVGAAGALFIIQSALLQNADHIIVVRPNYVTNIETPRAIGCDITFIDLSFEENFALYIEKIKAAVRPNTRLISITTPHNPTGTLVSRDNLDSLCRLAEQQDCFLLADETYRELCFQAPAPLVASLSKKAISVSSVSKAYGIPGIRSGWVITQDIALQQLFLAAKEQIHICNSVESTKKSVFKYLSKKAHYFPAIELEVKSNFSLLKKWMQNHEALEWVEPSGGVVCFPCVLKMTYALTWKIFIPCCFKIIKPMWGQDIGLSNPNAIFRSF